ncbi:MAG: arabinose isomerase, partial [Planctomycetes bacterium]|nr:arabinose isomerase [Planctomycetota bacterium]
MKIERRNPLNARVGIMGVGHYTYWDQFEGLLDVMHQKLETFDKKVAANGVETFNFGLSDRAQHAREMLSKIKAANIDLLFVDMVTYATSSAIAAIIAEIDVPIVLVVLQPLDAMDYENATTFMQLCNDDFCSVPEFTGVALRLGKPIPEVIIG